MSLVEFERNEQGGAWRICGHILVEYGELQQA